MGTCLPVQTAPKCHQTSPKEITLTYSVSAFLCICGLSIVTLQHVKKQHSVGLTQDPKNVIRVHVVLTERQYCLHSLGILFKDLLNLMN